MDIERTSNATCGRIIVLGANGMLGRYVCRVFTDYFVTHNLSVVPITRENFDFSQESEIVYEFLRSILQQSDFVVNCLGMTNKRNHSTAEEQLQFWRVNASLPRLLAIATSFVNGRLVHITTDCVFDGKESYMGKNSLHTSIDLYGLTKSLGDKALQGFMNTILIRTSIIGEESNNRSLVEWVLSQSEGSTLKGYTNHMWNGVTCLCLAKYILKIYCERGENFHSLSSENSIISASRDGNNLFGQEIILGTEPITKFDLVTAIADVFGKNLLILRAETPMQCFRQLCATVHIQESVRAQLIEMKNFDVLNRRNKINSHM